MSKFCITILIFSILSHFIIAQDMSKNQEKLWIAVQNENLEALQKQLKTNNNLDFEKTVYHQTHGFSPLHLAVWNRNYEMVRLLLISGAKADKEITKNTGLKGFTPLMLALHRHMNTSDEIKIITLLQKHKGNSSNDLLKRANKILADSSSSIDKKVWQIDTQIKLLNPDRQELEKYYSKWYELRQNGNNAKKLGWIARELGDFYLEDANYKKAFTYFEEFIELIQADDFTASRFWLNHAQHFYHPHQNLKEEYQKEQDSWLLKYCQKAFETSQKLNAYPYFFQEIENILDGYIRYSKSNVVNQEVLDLWIQVLSYQNKQFDVVRALLLTARKSHEAEKYMKQALEYAIKIKGEDSRITALIHCSNQYQQKEFKDYAKSLEIKLIEYDSKYHHQLKNPANFLHYLKDPVEMLILLKEPESKATNCILVLDNFLKNHDKDYEKIWAYRLKSRLLQYQKKYKMAALVRVKLIPFLGKNPKEDIRDLSDIGFLFQLAGDKTNALKYFEKAIEVTQNYDELESETAKYILKMAHCFDSFGDSQNAEIQYNKAYEIKKE